MKISGFDHLVLRVDDIDSALVLLFGRVGHGAAQG